MIYKGGVARHALCLLLGVRPEVIRDIDQMSSFNEDINASEAGGSLAAYMATRDCSINEVVIVDGELHWSARAERSWMNQEILLTEETPRAYFRAARFAARFCFALITDEVNISDIKSQQDWHAEAIHQWSKAIEDGCEDRFLDRVSAHWVPEKWDRPLQWKSIEEARRKEAEACQMDAYMESIELGFK